MDPWERWGLDRDVAPVFLKLHVSEECLAICGHSITDAQSIRLNWFDHQATTGRSGADGQCNTNNQLGSPFSGFSVSCH